MLHFPQWFQLAFKSTQPCPQLKRPGSQPVPVQRPSRQVSPVLQTTPQPPQWVTSVCASMQRPLHDKSPLLQLHLLLEHRCPLVQDVAQPPQCEELVSKLTQAPLQLVRPFEHSLTHFPPSQARPSAQTVLQEPQLLGLLVMSTHEPLHSVWPSAHPVGVSPGMQRWATQTKLSGQGGSLAPQKRICVREQPRAHSAAKRVS